eukprot:TRINITY_DN3113_c0_g2_i1.p1 TRINITY_DN3113_c0_g2~~TRINITY_DN3113_c0_g2_i1.p1  ORF type:complete len:249 (+),score=41.86 TRINITY_DN3113_c0_g2_i1:61-807(+)
MLETIDLKQPGRVTEDVKRQLAAVIRAGYSSKNLMVACSYDDPEGFVGAYSKSIIENLSENDVTVGLLEEGRVVGMVAALKFHVLNDIREGEEDSLDAVKEYSNIVGYLAELDRLAFSVMQKERGTNPLYDAFLTAYHNKDTILELGRGCTTTPNGLATMRPLLLDLCRRTGARFLIGRSSDHGVKFTKSTGKSTLVASLCYKDSVALSPAQEMSETRRRMITTPLLQTGRPPASHFFLIDLVPDAKM